MEIKDILKEIEMIDDLIIFIKNSDTKLKAINNNITAHLDKYSLKNFIVTGLNYRKDNLNTLLIQKRNNINNNYGE